MPALKPAPRQRRRKRPNGTAVDISFDKQHRMGTFLSNAPSHPYAQAFLALAKPAIEQRLTPGTKARCLCLRGTGDHRHTYVRMRLVHQPRTSDFSAIASNLTLWLRLELGYPQAKARVKRQWRRKDDDLFKVYVILHH